MAAPDHSGDDRPSRVGYLIAVAVSAIAHAGVVIFVLFVVPKLIRSEIEPPLSTSVRIVDSIPAGDAGARLPPINSEPPPQRHHATRIEPPPPPERAHPTPPPADEKNAIALNSLTPTVSPTPTPTPIATPAATPTPLPSRTPKPHRTPRPAPEATPRPRMTPKAKPSPRPRATPTPISLARAEATTDTEKAMEKVRQELLREHFKHAKPGEATGSEPIVADRARTGTGMGVGSDHGSAGMLQDPVFVMYYQDVQDRITKAFSFAGGDPDLTATVTFGINPDGSLNSLKVIDSSHDPTFDDSVRRAIRAAAPFGPPPEKYREAFAGGVSANFKLSELQAGEGG